MTTGQADDLVAIVAAHTPAQLVLTFRSFNCAIQLMGVRKDAIDKLLAKPSSLVIIEDDRPVLDACTLTAALHRNDFMC